MPSFINPSEICRPFSRYSQGALVEGAARWLHVSGQVGAGPDGRLEEGFEAQAKRAWGNLLAVLRAAGMGTGDLVKVSYFLTRAEDVVASREIRDGMLEGAEPAATLLVVAALAHPDMLIEVEAIAARVD